MAREPADGPPPQADPRLRRDPGDRAGARTGLRRGRLGARRDRRRDLGAPRPARLRDSSAVPTAWPRACPKDSPMRRPCRSSAPTGCMLDLRRWRRRPVLRDHRRLGERRDRLGARHPRRDILNRMSTTILDPTGERSVAERERLARPASLSGLTVGLLDISKPRGDVFLDRIEERLVEHRRQRQALPQADVHQARAGRPAPPDRHRVPGRHRGPRRLRQLHVVQCARHQRSRTARHPRDVRRLR